MESVIAEIKNLTAAVTALVRESQKVNGAQSLKFCDCVKDADWQTLQLLANELSQRAVAKAKKENVPFAEFAKISFPDIDTEVMEEIGAVIDAIEREHFGKVQ